MIKGIHLNRDTKDLIKFVMDEQKKIVNFSNMRNTIIYFFLGRHLIQWKRHTTCDIAMHRGPTVAILGTDDKSNFRVSGVVDLEKLRREGPNAFLGILRPRFRDIALWEFRTFKEL